MLYRTTACTSVTVSRGLRDTGKTQKPRGRTYGLRYLDPGRVHPRGELKQTVASGTGNHRSLYRSPHRPWPLQQGAPHLSFHLLHELYDVKRQVLLIGNGVTTNGFGIFFLIFKRVRIQGHHRQLFPNFTCQKVKKRLKENKDKFRWATKGISFPASHSVSGPKGERTHSSSSCVTSHCLEVTALRTVTRILGPTCNSAQLIRIVWWVEGIWSHGIDTCKPTPGLGQGLKLLFSIYKVLG